MIADSIIREHAGQAAAGLATAGLPSVPVSSADLPAEYGAALTLARAMLAAARQGDWTAVAALRRSVPALSESLSQRWRELAGRDPGAARRLERARLAAIGEIIAVDGAIRRLQSPSLAAVGDLIAPRHAPCAPARPTR